MRYEKSPHSKAYFGYCYCRGLVQYGRVAMDGKALSNSVVLYDPAARHWLIFEQPVRVCVAHIQEEVPRVLQEIQAEVDRQQLSAAGFVSYEAAPGFDPAFRVQLGGNFPPAWFALYREPRIARSLERPAACLDPVRWKSSVSRRDYGAALRQIKNYIRTGDTYQVNYSLRLRAPFAGEPWSLFARLVRVQGTGYPAFLETDEWAICSASPELFFRLSGADLTCRPMKGTASRGLWPAQDLEKSVGLRESAKNRAEDVMIVDMVRNDLGRVAQAGSVRVSSLFEIEKYATLWQMTSTVECRTTAAVLEIFGALFPAASITGAPKIRTMEIIAALEESPRRIYTGAIGFIAPRRHAQFSVAIRTVLIDKRQARAEYGIGGGIVWDSKPSAEFEECQTKARVLSETRPEFALLESILWTPAAGFFLFERHLRRLCESAEYFSVPVELDEIRRRCSELAGGLPSVPHRIRLLVDAGGGVVLEAHPVLPHPSPCRVRLAPTPINSQDVFLYHKTTERRVYEQARAACPDADDVLLWNEDEEITESTIANVVVEKEGRLLTPPLACGLLAGTYRSDLLEQKQIEEKVVRLKDLPHCGKVYLINSVRGMWEVEMEE